MTQEEKDLLLKDLCARLPYGVKVLCLRDFNHTCYNLEMIDIGDNEVYLTTNEPDINRYSEIEAVKPYLFPMSSMTEEQQIDLTKYLDARVFVKGEISFQCLFANTMDRWEKVFEWCDKNHFDYRGLIPMGLANDATGKDIY